MSKTFKEWMHQDISQVFIDTEEHGDMATINGVQVPVVWDGDELNYRIRADYQGLILGDALFYISADSWELVPQVSHPPRTDEAILINGRHATITIAQENAGMYDITIAYAGTGRNSFASGSTL